MTRITVLIPTFNRAEEVRRALESLCLQTYSDFFVIVTDNHSSDKTEQVVASYAEKLNLTYIKASKNFGPVQNWVRGLQAVRTEWVKILWSDDWLEPSALEELISFRDKHNLDVVLCGGYGHSPAGRVRQVKEGFVQRSWAQVVSMLIAGTIPVSASAGLLRTDEALNGLLTNLLDPLAYSTAIGPDLLLLYWPVIHGGIVGYLPKPLVNVFASEDSISVVLGAQCRPLYAHAILMACRHIGYDLMSSEKQILGHWIREGVVLKNIPELIGTPGKLSLRISLTTWPIQVIKYLLRKLRGNGTTTDPDARNTSTPNP